MATAGVGAGARAYFELAREQFARTEAGNHVCSEDFRIAGQRVRIRCIGNLLQNFVTTAIAHLRVETTDHPDLVISLWDSQACGCALPGPPWPEDKHRSRGEVAFFQADGIYLYYQIDAGTLGLVDTQSGEAFVQVESPGAVPYYEWSHPLRTILHVWLASRGHQVLHAGAVGTPCGAVLLVGQSGAGKSTASLACLREGMLYLGDDYTVVSPAPRFEVSSLYSIAKLNPDNLARFSEHAPSNSASLATQKALVPLFPRFAEQLVPRLPLQAIMLPRRSGRPDSWLTRVSPAEVMRAMAPSTVLQLPGAGQGALHAMRDVVTHLPCFVLHSGDDLATIPRVIREYLVREKVS